MQQGGGGAGGDPPQDRRLKAEENQNQPHQQHQPQKCPRCDSLNTKFCYYNNYSLSQPRYFCKTCRRYWTQGGTLRNVPVGGGCRKGKRTKASSTGDNSRSIEPQPPHNLTNQVIAASPALRVKESGNLASPSGISSVGSFYPGGGFLSSLAAIQSLHPPPGFTQPLNQPLIISGDLGGSSNLGLFQGYRAAIPSFGLQQPPSIPQTQFYAANREKAATSMYPSDQDTMAPSIRVSQQQNWHQTFFNNANTTASDAAFWNTNGPASTTSTIGNTSSTNTSGSSSLNPNQWPDLPGFGAPP